MPFSFSRRDLAVLVGIPALPARGDDKASELGRQLSGLIVDRDRAEEVYRRLISRGYSDAFRSFLSAAEFTDEQHAMVLAYEQQSGLAAAAEVSDAAYDRIVAFTDALLKSNAISPELLRVKARACLWEASAERLIVEGFPRVAALLTQLAAP